MEGNGLDKMGDNFMEKRILRNFRIRGTGIIINVDMQIPKNDVGMLESDPGLKSSIHGEEGTDAHIQRGCGQYRLFMLWNRRHFGLATRNKENVKLTPRPSDMKAMESKQPSREDFKESSILGPKLCCRTR